MKKKRKLSRNCSNKNELKKKKVVNETKDDDDNDCEQEKNTVIRNDRSYNKLTSEQKMHGNRNHKQNPSYRSRRRNK